jgi:type III pantothenate kinase
VSIDLVADVGNTRIKWGQCADGRVQRMCSLPPDDPDAWEAQARAWDLVARNAVVAGVNPACQDHLLDWLLEFYGSRFRFIPTRHAIPVEVSVEFPDKVGLDRLFNAVAVNLRRRAGQPAVIVDAGSAVTVDYLDHEGTFRGGAILPGLRLMAQALHSYTALLPMVEVQRRLRAPETSTERAVALGVFHAVLGGIELLIRDLHAQAQQPLPIFFAGGDAEVFAPHLPWPVSVWPEMTLEGIRISGERL